MYANSGRRRARLALLVGAFGEAPHPGLQGHRFTWLTKVRAEPTYQKQFEQALVEDRVISETEQGGCYLSGHRLASRRSTNDKLVGGEFSEYGRLTSGTPFRGLALASQQVWAPSYKFGIEKEHRDKLVGPVMVLVELKIKDKWKTVCTETLQFGSHPLHLRPLMGPVMSIPVYTRR